MNGYCPCCYQRILSTGGCADCWTQIWCHCGARFCQKHYAKEAAEHVGSCGIIVTNQGWPPLPPPNLFGTDSSGTSFAVESHAGLDMFK